MFLLYYLLFRSRNCLEKILLMSGLVFFGCLLSGAILGPRRFWDSPGTLLRPFFWTRGGKGVSLLLVPCVVFPRFVVFCGCFSHTHTHTLEGADPSSYEAYPRVIEPAPRPSEGPGSAIVRGRLDLSGYTYRFDVFGRGSQGPLGPFSLGRGRFLCPLRPFFTRTCFFFPPQVFFFGATLRRIA